MKLKEIAAMEPVNLFLVLCAVDFTGPDVAVEGGVGKAQVVLVGLSAEAVGRLLFDQFFRKFHEAGNRLNLLHREVA